MAVVIGGAGWGGGGGAGAEGYPPSSHKTFYAYEKRSSQAVNFSFNPGFHIVVSVISVVSVV